MQDIVDAAAASATGEDGGGGMLGTMPQGMPGMGAREDADVEMSADDRDEMSADDSVEALLSDP